MVKKKQIRRRNKKPKKRIRKGRLVLVLAILFLFVFSLFKVSMFIKHRFLTNSTKKIEQSEKVNNEDDTLNKKIIRIVLDPAKGGNSKGESIENSTWKEKDINLDIAKRIKNKLEKEGDISCIMTRDVDKDKTVQSRVETANADKADIFISIRVNAQAGGGLANGFETYYSDPSKKRLLSSEEKLRQKEKELEDRDGRNTENSGSDIEKKTSSTKKSKSKDNNDDYADGKLSEELAFYIQKSTLSYINMNDRGIKKKNFDVLYYTKMPSIIIQPGFITNKEDSSILLNDENRDQIADGITQGILNFIDDKKSEIYANRVNYR